MRLALLAVLMTHLFRSTALPALCALTVYCQPRRPSVDDTSTLATPQRIAAAETLVVRDSSQIIDGDLDVQGTLQIVRGSGPSETVVHGDLTISGTVEVLGASATAGRQAATLDAAPHAFIVAGVFTLTTTATIITPSGLDAPAERYVLPGALPIAFTAQSGGRGGDVRIAAREIVIEACNAAAPRLSLGNGGRGADLTVDDWAARTLGGQGDFEVHAGNGGDSGQLVLESDTISFRTCSADDAVILERAAGGAGGAFHWFVSDDHHWTISSEADAMMMLWAGGGGKGMRAGGAGGDIEYRSGKSVSDRDGPRVGVLAGDGGDIAWESSAVHDIPKLRAEGSKLGVGGSVLAAIGNDGASALPGGLFPSGGAGGLIGASIGGPGTLTYPLVTAEVLVPEPGSVRGPLQAGRGGEGLDMCDARQQGGLGGNGGLLRVVARVPVVVDASWLTLAVGGKGGDGVPPSVAGESGTLSLNPSVTLRGAPVALPPAEHGAECSPPVIVEEDPWHDTSDLPQPKPGSQFQFFDGSVTTSFAGQSSIASNLTDTSTSSVEDHITNTWPEQTIGRRTILSRSEGEIRDENGTVVVSTSVSREDRHSCDYVNETYVHTWTSTQTDRLKNETTVQSGTDSVAVCNFPVGQWGGYTLHSCYESDTGWVYLGPNHSAFILKGGKQVSWRTSFAPAGTPQSCSCRTFLDANGQVVAVPECI